MVERKYYREVYRKPKRKWAKPLIQLVIGLALFSFLAGLFLFVSYTKDLPRPERFTEKETFESTKIYDRSGQTILYEIFGEEKRTVVPLSQISDYLKKAVVATEDADFYRHKGVSLKGILRAILADLKLGQAYQGASTITQQLVRSSYLSNEKTSSRKTKEIILALEVERRYSKDEILEFYLNQVPFGRNSYGAEAASQTYFQKPAKDLSLAQAAALTALIKAPSYYDPQGAHLDKLLERKDYVLNRMVTENYISTEQRDKAQKEILQFSKIAQPIKAPHFVMWVKSLLEEKYGESFLKEKGLKVYTTIDWPLQEKAEKVIEARGKINAQARSFNSSLVALDPKSGQILAMVGSKGFFADAYPANCVEGKNCLFEPQFNVALAPRQPGSSFKPFVYATAFEKGYDDKTVVVDEPTNFGVWGGKEYTPQNYDGKFRGPVTLREALAQSLNIPSIKTLLYLAGLEDSVKTAENLGISTLKPPFGPSIVLGGYEVNLLEMASAYGTFAADGEWYKPYPFLKIEDSQGNVLEEGEPAAKRVLKTETTRLINDILSDNAARTPIFGANSPLFFSGFQVAVKTGTTQDYRDGWTIGYTPSFVVGVWTGNNDNSPMGKEPGVVFAGPIFHEVMNSLLGRSPAEAFPPPVSQPPQD